MTNAYEPQRSQAADPLRTRDFRLLVAGLGISLFANLMLRFAMSMWVLDETGSAAAFASILTASILPTILLSPLGGVMADRTNRRTVMVALDALSAVTVLVCATIFSAAGFNLAAIAVMQVVLAVLDAMETPTVQAALPQMFRSHGEDVMRRAMAVVNVVNQTSTLVPAVLGGVLMAACHGTWLDAVLKGLSTLLLSVPGFWLALFLITVFAEWLHLLPTSGLDRGLASLVLPAVALSAANVGSTSRFTRGNILAQLGEQYIVVANAKGLSQRAVMVGHAFRNSLVPIITLIGNYFGGILGGSTIIENIFAIPGLGSYVLSAIQNRDYPVIQGYVLITGTTFVLVTLAIDLLYIAVNPKIRLQGGEA